MSYFGVHTVQSAPAESAGALQALKQGLGFTPHLAGAMAESPALVNGFVELRTIVARSSELTGVEREIIALAVSLENRCDYCMAAHSTFALWQHADQDAVTAARAGQPPADPRLAALYRFARRLAATPGHIDDDEISALLKAGVSRRAALDTVAQAAHTTLANLVHGVTNTPLDDQFAPQAWAAESVAVAGA